MSAYSDALKSQAVALRAWAHTLDVQAGEHEKRAGAPKAPKTTKPSYPEHDYKPFTLTPAMLTLLKPKRSAAAARAEICRHCGLVRTLSWPYKFWDERGWRATRPGCVTRGKP